jgi:GH35 family endo-1,4-beta-xylanase
MLVDEVKGTKKKQITIALEERLVEELEEMATEMDILNTYYLPFTSERNKGDLFYVSLDANLK